MSLYRSDTFRNNNFGTIYGNKTHDQNGKCLAGDGTSGLRNKAYEASFPIRIGSNKMNRNKTRVKTFRFTQDLFDVKVKALEAFKLF